MTKHASDEHPKLKHPSVKRVKHVDADTPFYNNVEAFESQDAIGNVRNVVHWIRSKDLRIHDNKALYNASLLLDIYVHNRLRMKASSYLYCNLVIDCRRGERRKSCRLVFMQDVARLPLR